MSGRPAAWVLNRFAGRHSMLDIAEVRNARS
jgi:hypothetical protein